MGNYINIDLPNHAEALQYYKWDLDLLCVSLYLLSTKL